MDSPQTPSDEMIEAAARAIYEKDRSSPKWGSSLQSHESRTRWRLIAKEGLVAALAVSEARTTQLQTANATNAKWLVDISFDVRSAGDASLVRLSSEGVAPEPISLADELWLVAFALDSDVASERAAEIRERNGALRGE